MNEFASIDGAVTPTSQAVLPLPDDGIYRGDGVFEVVRLYGGRPFALGDHLDRLERSASRIALPLNRALIEEELAALLARNGDEDAQLRVIVTRGGRRALLLEPVPAHRDAVSLATVTYSPTTVLDRVKSLSYAANMHATRIAATRDADEAVLVTPARVVLEAPTSALFWASEEGRLRTPSLENPILDSITRDRLVQRLHVDEGIFDVAELQGCSEAFLASTTREVQPVSAIDGRSLSYPGPHTRQARHLFARLLAEELAGSATAAAVATPD